MKTVTFDEQIFVLVPRKANGNMIHAAVRVWDSSSAPDPEQLQVASETWVAMLAAAPPAPSGGLREIAKRNLRKMIELGSTDKKTMLSCLEELS